MRNGDTQLSDFVQDLHAFLHILETAMSKATPGDETAYLDKQYTHIKTFGLNACIKKKKYDYILRISERT